MLTDFSNCKIKKWQRHGDLVILNYDFLEKHRIDESNLNQELIDHLCDVIKCKRLAIKSKVLPDEFRTPQVKLVKGLDPWVIHIDNNIKYSFDITKCMFSFGNIKEKLRVSKLNCKGDVVVDLFAGIGYFTIPFLVHAKADFVYACDWNPDAIEALKKNLILNKVQDKCKVCFGDNKQVCPVGVADRVYMGLIPSSIPSLKTACHALKPTGGILHIHENVNTFNLKSKDEKKKFLFDWANDLKDKVISLISEIHPNSNWNGDVLEINKIKNYAPHIDHMVVDIKCYLL